ncbi:signal transduction histidine kinase [Actinokineospora baliensis]|uniref:sensor histidine kinase n=1 Tax=Actinokineospora baliensis TaxID=547056 RepID=UPI00195AE717|nr:ATP-binding protein [Actinokineospora baliensis]MBM7773686.1 signal transduction histidine kinase [Actinokineospora baliensis]
MARRDHGDSAVDAVLAAVATVVGERDPRPEAVAEAVGLALGAEGCELRLDGVRYAWGAGGSGFRAVISSGAELRVRPSRARLGAVAAVLAPVVDLIRLTRSVDDLRRRGHEASADLADGRWRAAAEMDTERRRIERDLHDGTQHRLVALRMAVAVAEHDPSVIATLADRLDAAQESLIRTAAGVLPPALAKGLVAALGAELAPHTDVRLDVAADLPRFPAQVETAVYFVCLEAVNNAHKHAVGAAIDVRLHTTHDGLHFSVRDDGPGFERTGNGAGLVNLTTRLTDVGGTVRVDSALGNGTTVEGFIPAT